MHDVHARGAAIPALGLGTGRFSGPAARELVREALAVGYRHLDTARLCGNEAEVRAGLRDPGAWPATRRSAFLRSVGLPRVAARAMPRRRADRWGT